MWSCTEYVCEEGGGRREEGGGRREEGGGRRRREEGGGRREEGGGRRREEGGGEEGGWRVEAGGRRQEAGGRRQEAGGRRQEAGGRRQEAGGRTSSSLANDDTHRTGSYAGGPRRLRWLAGEKVEGSGLKGLEEKEYLIGETTGTAGGVVDGVEDDIWWKRGRRGHSSGNVIIFPRLLSN